MKKFTFTLQSLYNVKTTQEAEARNRLAEIMRQRDVINAQIAELDRLYASLNEAYQRDCREGTTGAKLRDYGNRFEFMAAEKKKAQQQLLLCENKLAECQKALLKLINELKVLDRMRDEQLAEYMKEVRKSEEKELEDFLSGNRA